MGSSHTALCSSHGLSVLPQIWDGSFEHIQIVGYQADSLTLLYPDKVKVYHHRGNGLMAKSLLDSLDILSRLKQMGGIGMTERVGGKRNIKPGLGKRILQAGTYESMVDRSVLAEHLEHVIHTRVSIAVCTEHDKSLRGNRHIAVFPALALLDKHLPAVCIDVVPLEIACLKSTEAKSYMTASRAFEYRSQTPSRCMTCWKERMRGSFFPRLIFGNASPRSSGQSIVEW